MRGPYPTIPPTICLEAEGGKFIGGHGMSDEAKLRLAAGLSADTAAPPKMPGSDRTTGWFFHGAGPFQATQAIFALIPYDA
jgi:hypothetical protein